jgi:hypothetical protein
MSATYKLIKDGVVYLLGDDEIHAQQFARQSGGRLVRVEEPEPEPWWPSMPTAREQRRLAS